MDYSLGRLRASDEYWFAVRSAEDILWHNARTRFGNDPAIELRQKVWIEDDVYYSYNAARPIHPGNMDTHIGSVILCSSFDVKDGMERFSRQLIQFQISDILGDQLRHGTIGGFAAPEDAPISEKAKLINTMLSPDSHPEIGTSLDTTADLYFTLSSTLQLGATSVGGARD